MSQGLLYFDAHRRTASRPGKHPLEPRSLKLLADGMGHAANSAALVMSMLSVRCEPMCANRELSRQLDAVEHIFFVWNLLLHQTGEFSDPAELERILVGEAVLAFSVHPQISAGGLFEWLSGSGRPSLLVRHEFTTYRELATLDPVHYSREEMRVNMPQAYADSRFIKMKPCITFGEEYHSKVYGPWWEFGNDHHFPAGIHRGRGDFVEIDPWRQKIRRCAGWPITAAVISRPPKSQRSV